MAGNSKLNENLCFFRVISFFIIYLVLSRERGVLNISRFLLFLCQLSYKIRYSKVLSVGPKVFSAEPKIFFNISQKRIMHISDWLITSNTYKEPERESASAVKREEQNVDIRCAICCVYRWTPTKNLYTLSVQTPRGIWRLRIEIWVSQHVVYRWPIPQN